MNKVSIFYFYFHFNIIITLYGSMVFVRRMVWWQCHDICSHPIPSHLIHVPFFTKQTGALKRPVSYRAIQSQQSEWLHQRTSTVP